MAKIHGWGKYPTIETELYIAESQEDLRQSVQNQPYLIARGLGRSYGDSALGSYVTSLAKLRYLLDFDEMNGIVHCQSGVSFADLIESFLPRGWLPPVMPGTQYVTIGGAIASDIHGKNHHQNGCISQYILALELLTADGTIIHCSKYDNRDVFYATCGGMGLTGIILSAKLQLKKIQSSLMNQVIHKCDDFDTLFETLSNNTSANYQHAWLDIHATNTTIGRGLVFTGEHSNEASLDIIKPKLISLPNIFPNYMINSTSTKLFNQFYFAQVKHKTHTRLIDYNQFFFPLDKIHGWNHLYGKPGFIQYHFVVPEASTKQALITILQKIKHSGYYSFLSVLKSFGGHNENYLSFPMKGYALAVDFKYHNGIDEFLNQLDNLVHEVGGRIYLTKDARLNENFFKSSYPKLDQFMQVKQALDPDNKFISLQSKRLGIN